MEQWKHKCGLCGEIKDIELCSACRPKIYRIICDDCLKRSRATLKKLYDDPNTDWDIAVESYGIEVCGGQDTPESLEWARKNKEKGANLDG